MDHPFYSVTVAHLTAGWSYTAVEGVPRDPDSEVWLMDPFKYRGRFDAEVFPAQLTPSEVTFSLAASSAAVCPQPQPGDLVSFTVRIGLAGPVLARLSAARVTEPVMDIDLNDEDWPVVLTVKAVDLLGDLEGNEPAMVGDSRRRWMERASQIAASIGRSIGRALTVSPSNAQGPMATVPGHVGLQAGWSGSAREILTSWANSGAGLTKHPATGLFTQGPLILTPFHVASPGVKSGSGNYPVGFGWVAVSTGTNVLPVIADPETDVKYMFADAAAAGGAVLPLRMVVDGGRLILTPTAAGDHKAAIDAAFCELPARLRLGREHLPNAALVSGSADDTASTSERPFTYEHRTAQVSTGELRARAVPTQAILGTYNGGTPDVPTFPTGDPATIGAVFATPEPEALASPWTFDAFEFRPANMPQADAEETLPLLMVLYPGEVESGEFNVRPHVTLYRVGADARPGLTDTPIRGWVVEWELAITENEARDGCELVYTLTTTPGAGPAGTPITNAEFEAVAATGALTYADIDPMIALADLAAVDT